MSDRQIPRAPAHLRTRGRRLWRSIVEGFDLTQAEQDLLLEACRTLDIVESLEVALRDQPALVTGSRGQPVAHPLGSELRSERQLLAKLIAQLGLPDADAEGGEWDGLSASQRARKAAFSRWQHRGGVK